MKKMLYLSVCIFVSQFCVSSAWASGANFKIFGDAIKEYKENGRLKYYTATVTVGQELEIVAEGRAYPHVRIQGVPSPKEQEKIEEMRKGQPFKPNAGTWMFDDEKLRLLQTKSEGAQHKIVLEAATPGQYTVRFVGVVLGRTRTCEIQVNVSERDDK